MNIYIKFLKDNLIESYIDLYNFLNDPIYNIKIYNSLKLPELILLKVDKTDNLLNIEKLLNGIIINKFDIKNIICSNNYIIRSISFKDFNNIYENINDLETTQFFDGLQIKLYYYKNKWRVTYNNIIDSEDTIYSYDIPYKIHYLFIQCCNTINFDYNKILNKSNTYEFYLYHVLFKNVTQQYSNYIELNNITSNKTLKNIKEKIILPIKIKCNIKNNFHLKNILKTKSIETPGFIITDHENKIKYKLLNKHFIYVKSLKNISDNDIYRFIKLKQLKLLDEYLIYYPSEYFYYNKLLNTYNKYVLYFYESYRNIKIRKRKPKKYILYEKNIISKIHSYYLNYNMSINIDIVENILENYNIELLTKLLILNLV